MKKIVLVDTYWAGHVPTYHKKWVVALLESGYHVVSLTPSPADVLAYSQSTLAKGMGKLEVFAFASTATAPQPTQGNSEKNPRFAIFKEKVKKALYSLGITPLVKGLLSWKKADHSIRKLAPNVDLVLIPYLDLPYLVNGLHGIFIDLVFKFPWSGLFLGPTEARRPDLKPIRLKALSRLSAFKSRNLRALALLDEKAVDLLKPFTNFKSIYILPDITEESRPTQKSTELQKMLDLAAGRKIVLLTGELSKKKGILTLLELAKIAEGKPLFFVIVGALDSVSASADERAELMEKINQAGSNCFFHFHRVPDGAEYNSWIASCDLLFAVYENAFHSSNTMTKAALFEKPILVVEGYCTEERAASFSLGLSVPLNSPQKCLEAVSTLLFDPAYSQRIKPEFSEYAKLHSNATLKKALHKIVENSTEGYAQKNIDTQDRPCYG